MSQLRYPAPIILFVICALLPVGVLACGSKEPAPTAAGKPVLSLYSPAFKEGETLPAKYTCDGEKLSPPLAWANVPPETANFALILEDLDAPKGVFTHWVLFNLPGNLRELPEGVPAGSQLENGALQGGNDFSATGYGAPCPPRSGGPHRYIFTLYALDGPLALKAGASKQEALEAMVGHILAQGRLTGLYARQ